LPALGFFRQLEGAALLEVIYFQLLERRRYLRLRRLRELV
jgi:hypothetical protein